MSFADIARRVSRQILEDDTKKPVLSIIDFIESPIGLQFTVDQQGASLFPVQKFILKAYYGNELDTTHQYINIPKSWRYAGSSRPDHFYKFTEQEYLAYLHSEGRCNIKHLDHPRRELALAVGRRSGKSAISAMIAAYELYKLLNKSNPQRYFGLKPHDTIKICSVAPSVDQAKLIYTELRKHSKNCEYIKSHLAKDTQSEMLFQAPFDLEETGKFKDGGLASLGISFHSANAGSLRGHNNYVIILDEFAFFPYDGVTSDREVYQSITPSTAAFSPKDPNIPTQSIGEVESRIIMISSPFGKSGLFYEKFQVAMGGLIGSDDILMIQAPTWEVNPTVPASYLQKEYAKNPENFTCEFGAQFSDSIKSWIEDRDKFIKCIQPDLRAEERGRPRQAHFLGLDVAIKDDRTAVVLTRPEDGRIKLVYHEQWQAGVPWEELNAHLKAPLVEYAMGLEGVTMLDFDAIADWIEELSRRFYIKRGIFDQWNGYALEQTLKKRGLLEIITQNFTNIEKTTMFEAWKQMMYYEKHIMYNYPIPPDKKYAEYIQELLELEARKVSKHITDVQAPKIQGKHDDFSDAYIRSSWLCMEHIDTSKKYFAGRPSGNAAGLSAQQASARHPMFQYGMAADPRRRQIPKPRRRR
jgi:hypothetical protein